MTENRLAAYFGTPAAPRKARPSDRNWHMVGFKFALGNKAAAKPIADAYRRLTGTPNVLLHWDTNEAVLSRVILTVMGPDPTRHDINFACGCFNGCKVRRRKAEVRPTAMSERRKQSRERGYAWASRSKVGSAKILELYWQAQIPAGEIERQQRRRAFEDAVLKLATRGEIVDFYEFAIGCQERRNERLGVPSPNCV